jgi:hypothetical protein
MNTEYCHRGNNASNVGNTLQANWIPLSLIGVGIAWLVASNTGIAESVANSERVHYSGDADPKSGWVDQASGAAREAMTSVREAGTAVLDRATRYTKYGGAASDMAKRAPGQMAETLERNPWLIAIASMVAGAMLAGLFPPTRVEQKYVDDARDGLWTKANELGHQAAERVRELADSATPEHPSPDRSRW